MEKRRSAYMAWILCAIAILGSLVNIVIEYRLSQAPEASGEMFFNSVTLAVFLIVSAIVGAMIVSRHAKNAIGWLLTFYPLAISFVSLLDPLVIALPQNQPVPFQVYLAIWLNQWSWWLLIGPIVLIPLLFPNGRLLSRRWRWVVILLAAAFILFLTGATFSPTFEVNGVPVANPLSRISPDLFGLMLVIFQILLISTVILATASVFVRYLRGRADEREQIKWFLYACSIFVIVYLLNFIQSFNSPLLDILFNIAILGIPLAIGAAILRYHLYDIDLIINRTLVYVPLTAILAGLYSVTIAVTQKFLVSATGEKSDTAVVLTTFLLVATFTPIKNFLQQIVDKRFKESSTGLRQMQALEKQISSVLEVMDQKMLLNRLLVDSVSALHASGGAVYLNQDGELRMADSTAGWQPGTERASFPLAADGRQLGMLFLGPRKSGGDYRPDEKQALQKTMDLAAKMLISPSEPIPHLSSRKLLI